MANPLLSIETANAQAISRGALSQSWHCWTSSTSSAATVDSGKTTVLRLPQSWDNYASVDDSYAYDFHFHTPAALSYASANIEYELGTLTVSTNTFSAGTSAPTKTIGGGSSAVCVFTAVVIYASASLTATTPILTITYTDQAGNTGNTATLTLPTNAGINSGFLVYPHLAAGDTGIRAITNMSISTGSAGTLKAVGLLEIASTALGTTYGSGVSDNRNTAKPIYPIAASEKIAFYFHGSTASTTLYTDWVMVPTT